MTTIAYNHDEKMVAVDSRTCCNNVIVNDKANKIYQVGDLTFIACGDVPDIQEFMETYPNINKKLNCHGVMIDGGGFAYDFGVNDSGEFSKCKITYNDAFGSGCEFAIAAMDFGKTAKEAVEYAMTRDNKTGGKVQTIYLESNAIKSPN